MASLAERAVASGIGSIGATNTANSTSGAGTLNQAAGCTYTLLVADNTTDCPIDLPSITGEITINLNGASILVHHKKSCFQKAAPGIKPFFSFLSYGILGSWKRRFCRPNCNIPQPRVADLVPRARLIERLNEVCIEN